MIDFEKEFLNRFPNLNKHYLHRYLKLLKSDYSDCKISEKHHILPRSLWPEYLKNDDNIVPVPLRIHFILHKLLTKVIPDNLEVRYALFMMSSLKKYSGCIVYSKQYENIKVSLMPNRKLRASITAKKRVLKGLHNFQGKRNPVHEAFKKGTHPFVGGGFQKKRLADGTHNFQAQKPWAKPTTTVTAKYTWRNADSIYKCYKNNPGDGYTKIHTYFKRKNPNNKFSIKSVYNIVEKIKSGWIPEHDEEWLKFKQGES